MYCLKGFQDVSLTEDTSKFQSTKMRRFLRNCKIHINLQGAVSYLTYFPPFTV